MYTGLFLMLNRKLRKLQKGLVTSFKSNIGQKMIRGHILWSSEKHEYLCFGSHSGFKILFGIIFNQRFLKV